MRSVIGPLDKSVRVAALSAAAASVSHLVALKPLVTTTRYGFTGGGDTPDLTMAGGSGVAERVVGVAGGVIVAKRVGADVWSYPNIHGDIVATPDGGRGEDRLVRLRPVENQLTSRHPAVWC